MDRDRIIEELRRYFASRGEVAAAYLFGSVARGDDRATSDVDVALLLRKPRRERSPSERLTDFDSTLTIQADLQERIGREVDVIEIESAPIDLTHRILRDGIVVHDSDHVRRVEFELWARNEFFDFYPTIENYRRRVIDSA